MKRIPLIAAVAALAVIAGSVALLNGCQKKEAAVVSAEKNSFQEVTAHLDPGGSFYFYLGTEQWLQNLSDKVSNWRGLFASLPDLKADDRDKINKAFEVVARVIKDSGVEEVSGVGMSSIAIEKGLYRNKMFIHHYPGQDTGIFWKLCGQKPHALTGLDLLPSTTAMAGFSDLDVPLLWSAVHQEVAQSGFPEAQNYLNKLPAIFQNSTGLKWDQVLASLGGEFGVVLTLDESKMVPVPLPGNDEPLQIPEPGLMIVAKVKDDTIFNRLEEALQKSGGDQVVRVDKPNLKMRTMPVPLPLPIQLRLTVAASEGYLFIASSDSIIQEALAAKAGQKPGLKSTDQFKRLAKDIPQEGNGFGFVGQSFGRAMVRFQQQAFQMGGKVSQAQSAWLQSLFQPAFTYSVSVNTDEGWLTVANGNQNQGKMVLLSATVVPVAIGSAMLLPALAKAKSRAQQISCVNNMKQLAIAARIWAGDNNDIYPPNFLSMSNELNNPKVLICPQDTAHQPAANWSSFTPANCSYEYLTPSQKDVDVEHNVVVFRCPIHGTVGLGDGSVQMGIAKTHPDWLVQRNGKLYYEPHNGQ